jgi:hypothetical protein
MKKLHACMLLLGLGFVVYLVHRIGLRELCHQLADLGWGLVPLVCSEGLAELFHALSWRYCLSGPHASIPLARLFRINMAGYAISYLTPTASLGGDVTKAGLLALTHKGPEAVSGVLIGKLSFALAHLMIVVLGAIFILPRLTLPHALRVALLAGSILIALGIVIFFWIQKHGKLGALVRRLVARNIGGKTLRSAAHYLSNVDETLKMFYLERPWGLALSVSWHLLGYAVGIFQIWYFLHLLGQDFRLTLAAQIWFVGMWFDLLAFSVPLGLGVLEGSRIVAFRAFAYSPLIGITYAVVLRFAQLFWSLFGLASYASLISLPSRKFAPNAKQPRPPKPPNQNQNANPASPSSDTKVQYQLGASPAKR